MPDAWVLNLGLGPIEEAVSVYLHTFRKRKKKNSPPVSDFAQGVCM